MTPLFGCSHNPTDRKTQTPTGFSNKPHRDIEYCGLCGAVSHEEKVAS